MPAGALAEHRDQRGLAEPGHLGHGLDAARVQLGGGLVADAPEALDRKRVQEVELGLGRDLSSPSGLATALATLARNLVRAMPTVIGRPTCSRTRRAQALAISVGVPEIRSMPARVEEGLVDRQALDQRRGVLEDLEDRLARLRVGLEARRHHHGLGAEPARLGGAHRGPDAVGLGLVARPPARCRGRRSPGGRAAEDRHAARPRRRRSPGRRAESWPRLTRTDVRISARRKRRPDGRPTAREPHQRGEQDALHATLQNGACASWS